MNRFIVAGSALLALGLTASASPAAPLSGVGKVTSGAAAGIVQVHGKHSECLIGRWGFHRSPRWGGRIVCQPRLKRWTYPGYRHHSRGNDGYPSLRHHRGSY
jgi:hypothetical protein